MTYCSGAILSNSTLAWWGARFIAKPLKILLLITGLDGSRGAGIQKVSNRDSLSAWMLNDKCVYFYCAPYESPEKARYQHTALSLAEGLRELGIASFASAPYWQEEPAEKRFTICHDALCNPADCDAVVFNNDWLESGHVIAEAKVRQSQPAVYLNAADGWRTRSADPTVRGCSLVLRSHYNTSYHYPTHVKPWAFGLTNRILEMTREGGRPMCVRKPCS